MTRIEPSVIRAIKDGSEPAFEQAVFILEKPVYHYLYRLVGNRETAEDLSQETFLRVYRKRKTIDPNGNAVSWVFKIATNLARDWYRVQGRKLGLTFALPDDSEGGNETFARPNAYNIVEGEFMKEELASALAELRPVCRAVVAMHYFEDMPYDDISETLAIPENTVKTHMRRAKADLRGIIERNRLKRI